MNIERIKELIQVFENSKLSSMKLEVDNMKLKMEKPVQGLAMPEPVEEAIAVAPTPAPVVSEAPIEKPVEVKSGHWVKAPIVGTFYITRAEGSAPFIEIGQKVHKGDVLCIIEAMKVMNEIHAPVDGTIQEILVTNESMVEFDQELIRIGEAA